MGEHSAIEWTTHTFNPWLGCTKCPRRATGADRGDAESYMDTGWLVVDPRSRSRSTEKES